MIEQINSFFEDEVYLKRRLAFDDLRSSEELLTYYSNDFLKQNANDEILKEFLIELKAERHIYQKLGTNRYLQSLCNNYECTKLELLKHEIPFYEIYLPIISLALRKINSVFNLLRTFIIDQNAHEEILFVFIKDLSERLSEIGSQIYLAEFHKRRSKSNLLVNILGINSIGNNEYLEFITYYTRNGEANIFKKYPLLSHFIHTSLENWRNNITLLIQRMQDDYADFNRYFNLQSRKIKQIKTSLSDPHNNGQTVAVIHFEGARTIVYKPKDIKIDKAYNSFLEWFNETFQEEFFKTYKVLPKHDYGWCEYIHTESCLNLEEVSSYYKNAGRLLCLLYLFRASDCHHENIIAHRDNIVLIDAETLFTPVSKTFYDGFEKQELDHKLLEQLSNSVLATSLLPRWQYNKSSKVIYDISGLGAIETLERGYTIEWKNINTDGIFLIDKKAKLRLQKNVVILNKEKQNAAYFHSEIVQGFSEIYLIFFDKKKSIHKKMTELFSGLQIRFLFRPTSYYYLLKRNLFNPSIQKDKVKISLQLENLTKVLLKGTSINRYWHVYKSEVKQILRLNIPVFYSRTTTKELFNHEVQIKNVLIEDGFSKALTLPLSKKDLDFQTLLIKASFQASRTKLDKKQKGQIEINSTVTKAIEPKALLDNIYHSVSSQCIHYFDSVRWLGLTNVAHTECLQLQQHMLASTNNAGRMAVVMPHGVLFRGGDERKFREWLIGRGYLEAVIGLPSALFYGTGIGACVIVINKKDAHLRDHVFFINADREYKEGKNQNKLRPEDLEKIAFVYRHKKELPKYSKLVAKNAVIDEFNNLESEEYNLNIRRFVDNAPPAESHDVHAHLHGGIPENEVQLLAGAFGSYPGLRDKLFTYFKKDYLQFTDVVAEKEDIKRLFDNSTEIKSAHEQYIKVVDNWWQRQVSTIEKLPTKTVNVFDLYQQFSVTLTQELSALPILDMFKCQGAFATFWFDKEINASKVAISTDFKSVEASGWNAELIPDDEILESQYPDVLKELRTNEARRDELQALFTEVNELEDEVWNEEDYEVWRNKELKEHKEVIKALKGERKEADREYKNLQKRITANKKAGNNEEAEALKLEAEKWEREIVSLDAQIESNMQRFAKHIELEEELKACKKKVKEIKDRKQNLVDLARVSITPEKAKELILKRWKSTLHQTIGSYLQAYTRQLIAAVENLHDKYTVPLHDILSEREKETELLNSFLMELGYE